MIEITRAEATEPPPAPENLKMNRYKDGEFNGMKVTWDPPYADSFISYRTGDAR